MTLEAQCKILLIDDRRTAQPLHSFSWFSKKHDPEKF